MVIKRHVIYVAFLYECMMTVSGVDFQSFQEGEDDMHSPENSDELLITEGTTYNILQEKTGFYVPASDDENKKMSREIFRCKHPNCFWQGHDALDLIDHEKKFHAAAEAPQLFERESVMDEETFNCKLCKETFYHIADLEDHLLGHEEEKQRNIFGVTVPRTTLPPYEDIDLDMLIRSPSGKYLYCPLCTSKLYPMNFEKHYAAHLKRGY